MLNFDIPGEELAHGGGAHQAVKALRQNIAILIVNTFDADDQMTLGPLVADTLDACCSG